MTNPDFLLEIGCEELPTHYQYPLAQQLGKAIDVALTDHRIPFKQVHCYATPRRLAVLVEQLEQHQPSQVTEKLGPSIEHAYDREGIPTMACLGFANSCGVSADQLSTVKTPKGERICAMIEEAGKKTLDLLPDIIPQAVLAQSIPKSMRWGNVDFSFIRPVHWIVMLYGETPINASLFQRKSSNISYGHRFHFPKALRIHSPKEYRMQLYSQGQVVADFNERKKKIEKQIQGLTTPQCCPIVEPQLLNEVTSLVEWPVVLIGKFDDAFLSIPKEVLITAMQSHQKCFPVENNQGKLTAQFILVSNIESSQPETVIAGNEKVIHARLSDAAFFYNNDNQQTLTYFQKQLQHVLFQERLGSLHDKTQRITKLAVAINKALSIDNDTSKRAAQLCKIDLVSEMVVEFPSLQGIMGYYYATNQHETEACALAIKEHYLPRFSQDSLPTSTAGAIVAIADRMDTLVGVIGIKQLPTGDKDPFALRRAALGIIRIMIDQQISIDLHELIQRSIELYGDRLTNDAVIPQTFDFIMARLKAWYLEQGIPNTVFAAVAACEITQLHDFHQRIQAVTHFQTLPEANALAQANKRVSNLLKKQPNTEKTIKINQKLFESPAEKTLAAELEKQQIATDSLLKRMDYTAILTQLAQLQYPVDDFFDNVMVMTDDDAKRQNRLCLLSTLHTLFLQVADISLLQS